MRKGKITPELVAKYRESVLEGYLLLFNIDPTEVPMDEWENHGDYLRNFTHTDETIHLITQHFYHIVESDITTEETSPDPSYRFRLRPKGTAGKMFNWPFELFIPKDKGVIHVQHMPLLIFPYFHELYVLLHPKDDPMTLFFMDQGEEFVHLDDKIDSVEFCEQVYQINRRY